ncbi:acyl-CoA dehydrogenase family protein [Yinghuangia aomiensis]
MDLEFSTEEQEFRQEVRSWLEANVPATPLPSMDTEGSFRLHQEWEKALRRPLGGRCPSRRRTASREASLTEWLIFEEKYYRAGAPAGVSQNGIFLFAPTVFEFGSQEQRDRYLPKMASGEASQCRAGRAEARLRPGQRASARGPRRRARRLGCSTAEDLELARHLRAPPLRPLPHRPGVQRHHGLTRLHGRPGRRGRHRPPDPAARRRAGLRRGVPRRRSSCRDADVLGGPGEAKAGRS